MSTPLKTALEHYDTGAANYEASTGGCTRDVARYIIDICPPWNSTSVILDNACGTGIVTHEILRKGPISPNATPTIAGVDGAPGMIDLARRAIHANDPSGKVVFDVMGGEDLSFPDNHFTHSITNMGILFFKDGLKGAREIYRTLKPGGTAIVTSWEDLGYIHVIHQTQKKATPAEPLWSIPISEQWFQGAYVEKTLREAGFEKVEVHTKTVHYGAESVHQLCELFMNIFASSTPSKSEQVTTQFREELQANLQKAVLNFERPGLSGNVEQLVGVQMVALVAVATK